MVALITHHPIMQAVEAVPPEHRMLLSACMRTLAAAVAPGISKLQWVTAPHVLEPFFATATRLGSKGNLPAACV